MSGGSSGGSQQSVSTPQYTPQQATSLSEILSYGGGIYNDTKDKFAPGQYPGAAPVGFSPETLQAQQMMSQFAGGAGQQLATSAGKGLQFGLHDVLYPDSNPALQASIGAATRRIGEDFTSPTGPLAAIRGNFTAGNSGGTGTREGIASGIAGRSYLNTVGDVTAKMSSDAYDKGLDTFTKSMALAPGMYSTMLAPAATMGAVGAQKEGLAKQLADYEAQSKQFDMSGQWAALEPYANLATGVSAPGTNTKSTTQLSQFQQLMQGAGLGMLGFAML